MVGTVAQTLTPSQMASRGTDYALGRGVVQSDAEAVRVGVQDVLLDCIWLVETTAP